jgi:crossover junction endodeoxyribonuclease RusA
MLILSLPLPPSVNHYWGSRGNRRFVNKAGKEFKLKVQEYVLEYRVPKLGTARLQMTVTLHPRDKRKQDIDNRIKALWDALSGNGAGVFDDDEQIDILLVQRGEIVKGGACRVEIEVLDASQ